MIGKVTVTEVPMGKVVPYNYPIVLPSRWRKIPSNDYGAVYKSSDGLLVLMDASEELAVIYGVARTTIYRICSGKTRKNFTHGSGGL